MTEKQKKRPIPCRRKKALYRTALLLLVIFALILTNTYGFLPSQALRNQEDRSGVRKTEVLRWDWLPEVHPFTLYALSRNEDVVMLSSMRWSLLGGFCQVFALTLDCADSPEVTCGTYSIRYGNLDQAVYYFAGCIHDPDITAVKLSLLTQEGAPTEEAEISSFLEEDGHRVFAHPFLLSLEEGNASPVHAFLSTCDAAGQWSEPEEITYSAATSMSSVLFA